MLHSVSAHWKCGRGIATGCCMHVQHVSPLIKGHTRPRAYTDVPSRTLFVGALSPLCSETIKPAAWAGYTLPSKLIEAPQASEHT